MEFAFCAADLQPKSFAAQSGEKNIGVAILMPKERTSIGIERDLCGLGIECKQKFARLVFRLGVCFKAVLLH